MAENNCSPIEYLLQYAAEKGSLEGVKAALKLGADIDYIPPDSDVQQTGTALHIASVEGHVDIVRLLLRKGASVGKRSNASFTPLHSAALKGWTEIVELLVYHGATVDVQDGFQITPLELACGYKHVDTVRRLIEFGARPVDPTVIAKGMGIADGSFDSTDESIKLLQEAMKSKMLRCCNPKCGKPGYRSALKLCGRCRMTRYCSRDCQIQHWSVGHKKCCGHDACSKEQGPETYKKAISLIMADYFQKQGC